MSKKITWNKQPKRYIGIDYLVYVSSLPCCISGTYENVEAHHTKTKADKTRHDYYAIPLSRELHYMYHHQSREEFYEIASKVGITCDDDLRAYALKLFKDYQKGK